MLGLDFGSFVLVYLACTVLVVFVLLFGENLVFEGTPVAWLHWLITQGVWDGGSWLVLRVCGRASQERLQRVFDCCCEGPNPILQIAYVAIVLVILSLYWTHFFTLLPNAGAGIHHKYLGIAVVVACLVVHMAASFSDPGTVTPANAHLHAALYPNTGMELLWPDKECWTCQFKRPARSKHCSTCKRCVARHDHHCGWINNCVGLGNLRLFLLFLISNVTMCLYGGVLACMILAGELMRIGVLRIKVMNWRTGEAEYRMPHLSRLLEFVVAYYPVHASITLFMFLAALLLAAFVFYQLYLMSQGKTQYEGYRWLDLHKGLILEARELQAQQQGAPRQQRLGVAARLASLVRGQPRPQVTMPPNNFNRGFWNNLHEVLFWEWHLKDVAVRLKRQADVAEQAADSSAANGSDGRDVAAAATAAGDTASRQSAAARERVKQRPQRRPMGTS